MALKEQLAEYRKSWHQRVPAERKAIMERHIEQLRMGADSCGGERTMVLAHGSLPG